MFEYDGILQEGSLLEERTGTGHQKREAGLKGREKPT